jgi:hypothetical protein
VFRVRTVSVARCPNTERGLCGKGETCGSSSSSLPTFRWKVLDRNGQPVQAVDQGSTSFAEPNFYSPEGSLEASSLDEAKLLLEKGVSESCPSWSEDFAPENTVWERE